MYARARLCQRTRSVVGVTLKVQPAFFVYWQGQYDRYKILYIKANRETDLLHLSIGQPARFRHARDSCQKNGTPFPSVLWDTEPPTDGSCPAAWKDRLTIFTLNRKDRLLLVE